MNRSEARCYLHAGLIAALALVGSSRAQAGESVIGFRNGGTGAYPDADPPLEWSLVKNVKWRWDAPLFGQTISSPIIVGDRIITLARPMSIICLDKNSGKELWRRERYVDESDAPDSHESLMHAMLLHYHRLRELGYLLPHMRSQHSHHLKVKIRDVKKRFFKKLSEPEKAYFRTHLMEPYQSIVTEHAAQKETLEAEYTALLAAEKSRKHKFDHAFPTAAAPASDGERIYAIFGAGLLVCCDLNGELLWKHAMVDSRGGYARQQWTKYAEVPMTADGKVLATWGHIVNCLDAESGKVLWEREIRGNHCAATPVIGFAHETHYFMHSSGEVVRLEDGKTVFTAEYGGMHRYWHTSISADRRTFHYVRGAVRLGENQGEPPVQLWKLTEDRFRKHKKKNDFIIEGGHSYCAPVIHDGILYYHETFGGRFTALDTETGEILYGPLERRGKDALVHLGHGSTSYADMALAGEHLFLFSKGGDSVILKAGREFEVVRRNPTIGDTLAHNPVFEGARMYMRTADALFCFEKPEETR